MLLPVHDCEKCGAEQRRLTIAAHIFYFAAAKKAKLSKRLKLQRIWGDVEDRA